MGRAGIEPATLGLKDAPDFQSGRAGPRLHAGLRPLEASPFRPNYAKENEHEN